MIKVLIIGDESPNVIAHTAIPKALALAAKEVSLEVNQEWVGTGAIRLTEALAAKRPNAIWCVPGSPYASMEGALLAIRFARENQVPFLGTCGGFQHALIEFARNVLGIAEADHSESSPQTSAPWIAKLECALINKSETIRIYPGTRLAKIYGNTKATEPYQCSYGFNAAYRGKFESAPMEFRTAVHFSAFNDCGEVRAIEMIDHPFFVATLFQPERSALDGSIHPLPLALLKAAQEHRSR